MIFAITIDGRKYEVRSSTIPQAVKLALEQDLGVNAGGREGVKLSVAVEVHKAPAVRKIA